MEMPMSHLEPGMIGRVVGVGGTDPLRRRLLDLGFTPGVMVRAVRKGPLGSPTAFLIRGTLVALRPRDSLTITVDTGGVCHGSDLAIHRGRDLP
ncbi:MAG: FeoA family protein [Ignavibacteriales bacterium]